MASQQQQQQHPAPATQAQHLLAAYLLNDLGVAHHSHGQYGEAAQLLHQSLQLRGEAIDAAVAVAAAARGRGILGEEESGGRSHAEMDAHVGQLRAALSNAEAQGGGAEAGRIRAEEEAELAALAAATNGTEEERRLKLFRQPMRIIAPLSAVGSDDSSEPAIWTTVATRFSPGGSADASSVTLHNLSLVFLRQNYVDRASQASAMAVDALEDESETTDLARAVVHSNRAYIHTQLLRERGTDDFEEAAKFAVASAMAQQQRSQKSSHVAAGVALNAVAEFLREGRTDDGLDLCAHVCRGFPLEHASPESSSLLPSSSAARIARRAHLLLAEGLHMAGTRYYHDATAGGGDHLKSALRPLVRALYLRSVLHGDAHPRTAETMYLLGRLLHDREEYVDALGMYERAMAAQTSLAARAQERSDAAAVAAQHQHQDGQAGASVPSASANSEVSDLLNTMTNATKVHLVRGSLLLAMDLCSSALDLAKSRFLVGAYHLAEFIVVLLHMKGSIRLEMGDARGGVECFAEAVRIARLTAEDEGNAGRLPPLINMGGIKNDDACQGAAAA